MQEYDSSIAEWLIHKKFWRPQSEHPPLVVGEAYRRADLAVIHLNWVGSRLAYPLPRSSNDRATIVTVGEVYHPDLGPIFIRSIWVCAIDDHEIVTWIEQVFSGLFNRKQWSDPVELLEVDSATHG